MRRTALSLALSAGLALTGLGVFAQPAGTVDLADHPPRLRHQPRAADVARFSDIFAHVGLKVPFVYSCYLVKHGDDYMLWDTGHVDERRRRSRRR